MITFQQYLAQIGFFGNKSPEDWAFIRGEYRKFYQREYQKNRKKFIKRVEIQLNSTEYEMIKKVAESYGENPTSFMRKAVLSFVKSEIFLPNNTNLDEVKMLIRRSSNNINQLVYSCHRNQIIHKESLQSLVIELKTMEQNLAKFYEKPKIIFKPFDLCS